MINGQHIEEEAMPQLQHPKLKASSRAVPSTTNPVSPPAHNRPTSSTSSIPMDIGQETTTVTRNNADVKMRAETISSGSRTLSTRNNLVTQQCGPMVRTLLDSADFYPIGTMSATDKLDRGKNASIR
eukprot:993325-Amphidinium_carterae.3